MFVRDAYASKSDRQPKEHFGLQRPSRLLLSAQSTRARIATMPHVLAL